MNCKIPTKKAAIVILLVSLSTIANAQVPYLVKDINPGPNGSGPYELTNVNGTLFFRATDGINGIGLWKSNGTSEGTVPIIVSDPAVGKAFFFSNFVNGDGVLFFLAAVSYNDFILWKSDGTTDGTSLIKKFDPEGKSFTSFLTFVNRTLFFIANDQEHGIELWRSNGTAEGTLLVKDINPVGDSQLYGLTNVNGTLFFFNNKGFVNGYELWKSDGSADGTVLLKTFPGGFSSPFIPTNANGTLFFFANDGVSGFELWKSDGTATGTVLVKDINPGNGSSISSNSFYQSELINVNGTLFFGAVEGTTTGLELWKSDGSLEGTVLVKDINQTVIVNSFPRSLTAVNGSLFFWAFHDIQRISLWKSDGTPEGTLLVKDLTSEKISQILLLTDVNGTLFFASHYDAFSNNKLWKSDGTADGTVEVGPPFNPIYLTNVDGTLLFSAEGAGAGLELWALKTQTTSVNEGDGQPALFGLFQNYPNPFNPSTKISFALPSAQEVTLKIFNLAGQEVATLLDNEHRAAGVHALTFEAQHLPSGIYLYRLQAGEFVETKRMVLIR
ncbi:T9SS type A sorting domain-containing protein [bacterium]|nr:T9SS type A sorting domain-containing protein [bacterium]